MTSRPDDAGARGGIGARLRSARERAALSPIQAAERLHMDAGALGALEAERFDELGPSVYVRGYLRHYAELVGESPAELLELYSANAHASRVPDLARVPRASDPVTSGTLLFPGIAVVISVALIGTAWWISGSVSRAPSVQRAAVSPPPTGPGPSGAPAGSPLLGGQAGFAPAEPRPPAQPPPAAAPRPVAQPGKASALEMHFAQDSWTEVYDARGQRLFFDVGHAGSTRTVRGVPPLRVVLGNPPEVALQLDGRPVRGPEAPRNVITGFRIERSGLIAPIRLAAAERRPSGSKKQSAPAEMH